MLPYYILLRSQKWNDKNWKKYTMVQMIPIMIVGATVHVLAKVNVTKTVTAKVVANEKF